MTELATTTRGDRVAYDRYGPVDPGPALVMVAGAGSLRGEDTPVATARLLAAEGVRVLVPDRLGRGESPAEGRLDLDREVEGLRAVVDAAGGHAVLCAHSSGCAISLYAAAEGLPVDGLVLWEAPMSAPAEESARWVDELERRLDDGELEAAQEWYMK
ncbi:MAG: alpha/beta hydrolase, partial [Janthinobacterium lividum]